MWKFFQVFGTKLSSNIFIRLTETLLILCFSLKLWCFENGDSATRCPGCGLQRPGFSSQLCPLALVLPGTNGLSLLLCNLRVTEPPLRDSCKENCVRSIQHGPWQPMSSLILVPAWPADRLPPTTAVCHLGLVQAASLGPQLVCSSSYFSPVTTTSVTCIHMWVTRPVASVALVVFTPHLHAIRHSRAQVHHFSDIRVALGQTPPPWYRMSPRCSVKASPSGFPFTLSQMTSALSVLEHSLLWVCGHLSLPHTSLRVIFLSLFSQLLDEYESSTC